MNQKNLAFTKINFILLAVGFVFVVLGFMLMSGDGSTTEQYNPEIFSARRIKVAPLISLVGFLDMIFAILYRPKAKEDKSETQA